MGLEENIQRELSSKKHELDSLQSIDLSFNIDGLPIFRSSNVALWPVQCVIANIPDTKPFIVALYSGHHKPKNLDFLHDFVAELKKIMEQGIRIDNSPLIPVHLKCIICDAPAKAQVKGIVQYNGRFGCDYCDVQGEHKGTMLFLGVGEPRTDETFRSKKNPEHHKVDSPLLDLNVDMILNFPIDPMHCVDLGVTRRLLLLWKEGPVPLKLSAGQIAIISGYNQALAQFIPREFNRKPRRLDDLRMWKATEYHLFLKYIGPLVLKYVLPTEKYVHFLCLHVAIRILYSTKYVSTMKKHAHALLKTFVDGMKTLYTERCITYNVHCLQHMAQIAEVYGSLDQCTAYPFENNMAKIKRIVRGPTKPLVQVARRLAEMNNTAITPQAKNYTSEKPKVNDCYQLKNGKYCTIDAVQISEGRALCQVYARSSSYFSKPFDSRKVGVVKVNKNDIDMQYCDFSELAGKAICVPLSVLDRNESMSAVIISLVHSL